MAFAYTCHIDMMDQDEEGEEGVKEGANAGAGGGVEGAELTEQQRERRRRRRRSRVAVRRLRIFTCQFNKSAEVSRVQASLGLWLGSILLRLPIASYCS